MCVIIELPLQNIADYEICIFILFYLLLGEMKIVRIIIGIYLQCIVMQIQISKMCAIGVISLCEGRRAFMTNIGVGVPFPFILEGNCSINAACEIVEKDRR